MSPTPDLILLLPMQFLSNKWINVTRLIFTVLLVHVFLAWFALYWVSGRGSASLRQTQKVGEVMTQRNMQLVKEPGVVMFGGRQERVAHQLKVPEWSGSFSFPFNDKMTSSEDRKYRYGVSITRHDKPERMGFKAVYVHVKLWLVGLVAGAAAGVLWLEKWLFPLARLFRRSTEKSTLG